MSDSYQQFRATLAQFKTNLKNAHLGAYIPEKLTALLNNKGVIRVTQADVRRIDFAVKHLQIASDSMASALAALNDFNDLSKAELIAAQSVAGEYQAVLTDVVQKAYKRRMQAAEGVAA